MMSMGSNSFFWQTMASLFPALELSRFPFSDYKIFIAIPLVIFAIVGIKAIVEGKFSLKKFAIRTGFVLSWFSLGIYMLYSNFAVPFCLGCRKEYSIEQLNQHTIFALLILGSTLIILAYLILQAKSYKLSNLKKPLAFSISALVFLSVITTADGFRFISDLEPWNSEIVGQKYIVNNIPLEKNGKLATYSIFDNLPTQRPERQITEKLGFFSWKGVLTGDYMMQDSGNTKLIARFNVESNDNYMNYMFMQWTPILVEPPANSDTQINLPEEIFANVNTKKQIKSIVQTHYGINDINYQVSLSEPKLLVENEIYFPGWKATLVYPGKQLELEAIEVNDVFRAWLLPAGDYEMTAYFEFPNLQLYQSVTIVSLVVWIGVVVVFWRKIKSEEIVKMN